MSLDASSPSALEAAIRQWQERIEAEHRDWKASPDGISMSYHDCSGTHSLRAKPAWAPEKTSPDAITLEFRVRRQSETLAHVCLAVWVDAP